MHTIFLPILGVPKKSSRYYKFLKGTFKPAEMVFFKKEVQDWLHSHEPNLEPLSCPLYFTIEFFLPNIPRFHKMPLHDMASMLLDSVQGLVYKNAQQVQKIIAKKRFVEDKLGIQLSYSEVP